MSAVPSAYGNRRHERRIAKFRRMIAFNHGPEAGRIQWAVDGIHVLLGQMQRAQERLANLARAIAIDLQPYRIAFATIVELIFDRLEVVLKRLLTRPFLFEANSCCSRAAWAAAKRATGTRYGEQLT